MARGDFAAAIKLLPSTFREVYSHPKVCEQIKVIGVAPVKAMIQVQLGILASLMTTGGNLNEPLADFIAGGLIEMYPTESVADFQLCFQRGAMGRYGSIQRMDGITIGEWMGKYLDEKYAELEGHIEKRKLKATDKEPIEGLENQYLQIADESAKAYSVQRFNRKEMARQFGSVDMDTIEKLRAAELEGKHVHKLPIGPYTQSDYKVFLCDGKELYATNEKTARHAYIEEFGEEPREVKPKEI